MVNIGLDSGNRIFCKTQNLDAHAFNACNKIFHDFNMKYNPEDHSWGNLRAENLDTLLDRISDIDSYKILFSEEQLEKAKIQKSEQEVSPRRIIPDYSLLNFPPITGKHPFEDFQRIDIQQGLQKSRYAWFLGMGSGKSYILSAIIAHRYKSWRQVSKVVVLTTSIGVWNLYHEILKFVKDLNPDRVYIADRNNRNPFNPEADIVIMSYNTFRMICNDYKKDLKITAKSPRKPFLPIKEWACDRDCMLCLDESHEIARPNSQRGYLVHLHASLFRYRYLFTGTPADTPEKLYNQFDTLDPWLVYNLKYSEWMNKVAYMGMPWSRFAIRAWNEDALKEQNERFTKSHGIYRKSEDIVNLPEHNIKTIYLPMEEHHRQLYQDLIIEDMEASQNKEEYYCRDTISRFSYMMLACDSPSLLKKNMERFSDKLQKEISKFNPKYLRKYDAVEDIIEEHPDEKGIIWIIHPSSADILKKRFERYNPIVITGETDNRNELIEQFKKDPKHKLLIGSILVLNTSTTITEATFQIYAERTFNYTIFSQSQYRIYRQGQQKEVATYFLCYDKSLDCLLDKNLQTKGTLVEGLCKKDFIDQATWKKLFNFTEKDII